MMKIIGTSTNIFYGASSDLVDLYKTKPTDVSIKVGFFGNNSEEELISTKKFSVTPNVNVLSLGGEFQKYDDLINKVLEQGNTDSRFDGQLKAYANELDGKETTQQKI